MPAWKLTADSIWNSFRSSGKKHLLITGTRGAGKSTILAKLIPEDTPGIVTRAIPKTGVYLREIGTDRETRIGVFDADLPGQSGRMRPELKGFTELGIPALRRCVVNDSPCIRIDEIGFLETSCPEYCAALEDLLDKKQVVAAVRKQELPFLTNILRREDAFVLDVDAPFGNAGCIIMASGMGARFGGNKLMADFQSKPLIAGALAATEDIPHRVVVTRHRDVAEYCRKRDIQVILHDLPDRNDTVRLGVEVMEGTDCCIFCQGDQPLLKRDTVSAMVMLGVQHNAPILRAAFGDTCGAPILFPSRFYSELSSLPQGKGGSFTAKKHPEQVRNVQVRDPYELWDADTPEDLAFLAKATCLSRHR